MYIFMYVTMSVCACAI